MKKRPRKPRTLWDRFKQALSRRKRAWRVPLGLELLEDRITPTGDLWFQASGAEALTLRLSGEDLQIIDTGDPSQVRASRPLSAITTGVRIEGNGYDVGLTIDASLPQVPGGVLFVGGSGTNTLTGPGRDTTWRVTGAGEGHLGDPGFVRFTGIENLTGAADNQDTFVIDQGGSLAGTVEGGAGGYDTVRFTGAYRKVGYEVTGPQSGDIVLDGQTVRYSGMEPIQFTQAAGTFPYAGTAGDDTINLHDIPDAGGVTMEISGTGETVQFANPTGALVIAGEAGNDTITVSSFDPLFSAGLTLDGGAGGDQVIVAGGVHLLTRGGDATIKAEQIELQTGVVLDTTGAGPAGSIRFEAKDSDFRVFETPVGYANHSASISLTHATIKGGDVTLSAEAKDLTLASTVPSYLKGFTSTLSNLAAQIPGQLISALAGFDASVVIRGGDAHIGIADSAIESSGSVNIASTTKVETLVQAIAVSSGFGNISPQDSFLVSVGYGQATSTVETLISG